jgi:crotonobetainyl-CoA:carnitine CoA-transferase CaiB-like acyl-CoA transferase
MVGRASLPSAIDVDVDNGADRPSGGAMAAILQGVRILEVAEQTFVPSAAALLSDWGAEVVKIEHHERGDAMRGLASAGIMSTGGDVHALMEHSNRGKKSLGLNLATDEGREIVYKLAAQSDVFLHNKLPSVRKKLKVDLDDIRAHNPSIIYVSGTGQGERGPDADRGAYDSLAFWNRTGVAYATTRPEYGHLVSLPGPGFGDSLGGMTIAGGIMGALFHRERTGEALVVDVSLLATGMWAMGQSIALSLLSNIPQQPMPLDRMHPNPTVGSYRTKDDRWLVLSSLQPSKYFPELVTLIGKPEWATDPRFADHESLMANRAEAVELLKGVFGQHTIAEIREMLNDFSGQWAVAQDTLEVAVDPQTIANGYLQDVQTASGSPFKLVAAPVQFDGTPAQAGRSPEFNEHGDAILAELGLDWDTIVDYKVRGIVA